MNTENKLTLRAHSSYSYVPRTCENASADSADVTVAFATDFTTAGERLTKREAGPRYIGIAYGIDVHQAASSLVAFINARSGKTLNVAGNGIYSLAEKGVTQAQCNQWVYDVLALVAAEVSLTQIRSGGQTGIDQAGLVAAIALGIPAYGLYPASFRRRNSEGTEVTSTLAKIQTELESQAQAINLVKQWRFHQDGTAPTDPDAIFVFGSNLAGRHGKGAAAFAKAQFGAQEGVGAGPQGNSYGIPTKDGRPRPGNPKPSLSDPNQTLRLFDIKPFIVEFIEHAKANPDKRFFVTRVGCQLAGYEDKDIAPLFSSAPSNCSFAEEWKPFLMAHSVPAPLLAKPINIWSGAKGLGGALTNMTERAREKGGIQHPYPVKVNGVTYPDSEAAYQALKVKDEVEYNDGLMIDILALKFQQHPNIFNRVTEYGGEAWLETCGHYTNAKSPSFQSWEGVGTESRFIRNLALGYRKAKTGLGPITRVVHVKEAPYDVYIGRHMGDDFPQSEWHNPAKVDSSRTRETAVKEFYEHVKQRPDLMAKVKTLKGRTLGCWCKSRTNVHCLCHGDVLVALAEGREWEAPKEIQSSLF